MDYSSMKTTARIAEWRRLTKTEFDKIDRAKTVVIVTCAPLEVHGPHLPINADIEEAEGLTLRSAEILCERDPEISFLHLPPIYVATDVLPQRGSLMFRIPIVIEVLADLGRSLAAQGFRHIWVTNFHGGPRHFIAIEKAAARTNRRYGTKMISVFSLMMKNITGGGYDLSEFLKDTPGISREELVQDTHAGVVETSLMLKYAADRVDPCYPDLPRRVIDHTAEEEAALSGHGGIRARLRAFLKIMKYFEEITYCGNPGKATRELGELFSEKMAGTTADKLADVYNGRLDPKQCHSPLWPYRFLITNSLFNWVLEKPARYRSEIF